MGINGSTNGIKPLKGNSSSRATVSFFFGYRKQYIHQNEMKPLNSYKLTQLFFYQFPILGISPYKKQVMPLFQ